MPERSSIIARLIARTLFVVCIATAHAVTLQSGPKVETNGTSATITWQTDVACGTRLHYGTNVQLLNHRVDGDVGTEHRLELRDLKPGTTYYFSIGSSRSQLATGKFQIGGKTNDAVQAAPPRTSAATPPRTPPPAPQPPSSPAPAAPIAAPPTRATWGSLDSLQDHFNRHGKDFKATSPDDYAAQAWAFLQRAKQGGLSMKWDDADGTLRVYDSKTGAFAAYDRRGKTRTYFKPTVPWLYWQRQPGRTVQPGQLAN